MDGQPGMADGWDTTEVADPRIYRAVSLGWIDWTGEGLRWADGHIVGAKGKYVESDSINSIVVVGVVERVPDLISFWHELYRVCAHAAQVTIQGPYWSCVDALADPTRIRGLSEQMFNYLSAPSRVWLGAEPHEDGYALDLLDGIDFDVTRYVRVTGPEWEARSEDAKAWGLAHSVNVCRRLEVVLTTHKPARPSK